MNRLCCIVFWCMVLTFGYAASSLAIPGSKGTNTTGDGKYIGGIVNNIIYIGEDPVTGDDAVLELGVDLEIEDFESPFYQDHAINVNLILDTYNEVYNIYNSIDQLYETNKYEYNKELLSDSIDLNPGTEFISIKWDHEEGGWFLWNVAGLSSFSFNDLSHGISHYSEWSAAPVPEPASALLLLAGLLGFGAYRKKYRA